VEKAIITGVITESNTGARTPPSFKFVFIVEGKKYEGRHSIVTKLGQKSSKELLQYVGRKYKVCYVVEDPGKFNKLLIDRSVE